MHDQKTTTSADLRPLAGTDAASAPPCAGFTLRGRTWVCSVGPADQADRTRAAGRGLIG